MRKFEYPEIKVSKFMSENIVIASNDPAPVPVTETANEAAQNWLVNNGVASGDTITLTF